MMGVMDLGLMDRESGAPRSLTSWAPDPVPAPIRPGPPPPAEELQAGGGYAPQRSRGAVLAAILALHVLAIGALATARYQAVGSDRQQRVTSFTIQEPPPPPPLEPLPAEPAVQPVSAPIAAPVAAIEIPRQVEVQAVRPEAVRPEPMPVAQVVNQALPAPTPARPAPAAPAPILPPDFTAAQLRNAGPAYPYLSRRAREEGVVLLKVLVSTEGRAARLEIQESSGYARLDEAALKTVGKWRFVPATQAGQPREAWVLVPVTFSLG
jgi:protein TonB